MARIIVRRHSLAEKLLQEVLQVGSNEMDSTSFELLNIFLVLRLQNLSAFSSSDLLVSVQMENRFLLENAARFSKRVLTNL